MRICYFDLETRIGPTELGPDDIGWTLLKQGKGGISALAIYDSCEQWCRIYDDTDILRIADHLEAADLVVGFNSIEFDVPCVEGVLGRKLVLKNHLDLYVVIKETLISTYPMGYIMRKGEYKLGSISERTFGDRKLEESRYAPELAKEGKWGRLFNYCCDDVRLTLKLHQHIEKEGGIISAGGTFLPISLPPPSATRGVIHDIF